MKGATTKIEAFLALLTIVVLGMPQGGEAVTCSDVEMALLPCLGYLIGQDGEPSAPCCDGVKRVKELTGTTEDKRTACSCVKAAAARYTDLKEGAAKNLPTKCGVQLGIPVSRNVDCDRIN